MEIHNPVDQRGGKLPQFLAEHRQQLVYQGAIVGSWRRRGGKTTGPYYRLTCRDAAGRQRSVYLGADSTLVAAARRALRDLQASAVAQRQLAQVRTSLQQGLLRARRQLDDELAALGLRRQGSEVRGWSRQGARLLARLASLPLAGDPLEPASSVTGIQPPVYEPKIAPRNR